MAAPGQPSRSPSGPVGFAVSNERTLTSVADRFGVKAMSQTSVRLAVHYRSELERWIRAEHRTGTMLVFYTQGTAASCGWEERS